MRSRSMKTSWCTFAPLVLLLLASPGFCSAKRIITQLDEFDTIVLCAPLNILVLPSSDGASMVQIEADEAAAAGISAAVSSSALSIETKAEFQTDGNIKVKVFLPASALRAVEVRSSSVAYLAPGFATGTLKLTASQLGGSIVASQLAALQLSVSAEGLGKVTVEGSIGEAVVRASDAASVHISGLANKANLSLTGHPDVAITATTKGAKITGTSQGSKVLFSQGTCTLKGSNKAAGALCVKQKALEISAAPVRWTCKAAIAGTNLCQTSGSMTSTFSSTGGDDCSIMTWKGAEFADRKPTSTRKLSQTSTSSVSSSSSSSGSRPTSYTYTTTSTGTDGQPSITSCSFVNNKGGCQVNGVTVPVQQYGDGFSPAPAPEVPVAASAAAQIFQKISQAATAASTFSSGTSGTTTSSSGSSCAFVNGIGGCQTTG